MIETVSSIFYYIAAGTGAIMGGVAAIIAAGKHRRSADANQKQSKMPDQADQE